MEDKSFKVTISHTWEGVVQAATPAEASKKAWKLTQKGEFHTDTTTSVKPASGPDDEQNQSLHKELAPFSPSAPRQPFNQPDEPTTEEVRDASLLADALQELGAYRDRRRVTVSEVQNHLHWPLTKVVNAIASEERRGAVAVTPDPDDGPVVQLAVAEPLPEDTDPKGDPDELLHRLQTVYEDNEPGDIIKLNKESFGYTTDIGLGWSGQRGANAIWALACHGAVRVHQHDNMDGKNELEIELLDRGESC